jgi:hypothetical protein
MRPASRLAGLLLGACLLTVVGCGDEGQPAAQPLGQSKAGSVASLVQCTDWNAGDEAEKLATIADLRAQLGAADGSVEPPDLSDDQAMQLFDNQCRASYAASFRLYKLYARAATFAPLLEQP